MTRAHLHPCPACARHVRVSEASCPFCGESLGDALRGSCRPLPPAARLTRAALFAFGTGTLALAPACSSSSSESPPVLAQPAYGGVAIDDASNDDAQGQAMPDATTEAESADAVAGGDATVDATVDAGSDARVVAAYGAPPYDAAPDHIVVIAPPYGIPPH